MGVRRVSPAKLGRGHLQAGPFLPRSSSDTRAKRKRRSPCRNNGNWTRKRNSPTPQRREDQQAPGYDNNTKEGWLVGKGPVHPHFDATPKSKKRPY